MMERITMCPASSRRAIAAGLVALMMSYQWFLCFISTNVMSTPSSLVAAIEACIVLASALLVLRSPKAPIYSFTTLLVLFYFASLMIIRRNYDLQPVRNVIIPLTFFFMGQYYTNRNELNKLFKCLSWLVLIGVILEYGATDTYLHYFNIQHYYTDRGLVKGSLDYLDTNVLFNGERFSGRNLFPFLGNQRISSIFLEPVSMGNFAILLAAWGLSFPKEERAFGYKHLLMASVFVVAADSRFGCLMFLALIGIKAIPLLRAKYILPLLPIAAFFALLTAALIWPEKGINDSLLGRIVRSGQALTDMSLLQWLGIGTLEGLGDMGFAYTIEHMGLLIAMALVYFLTIHRYPKGQASTFRAMAAYYAVGILMISGTSFYSAKTASLLWFALGALYAQGANALRPHPTWLFSKSALAETSLHRADRH